MKSLEQTIAEVKAGGAWNVMDEILFYLDQFRPVAAENARLREANTVLTDQMAAYRSSWGELYKEKFGRYPSYPF